MVITHPALAGAMVHDIEEDLLVDPVANAHCHGLRDGDAKSAREVVVGNLGRNPGSKSSTEVDFSVVCHHVEDLKHASSQGFVGGIWLFMANHESQFACCGTDDAALAS